MNFRETVPGINAPLGSTLLSRNMSNMWGFLCFEVEVTSYQLWNTNYSPYQSYLHDRVKKLKSEGLGYRRIANKLNEEGLKTVRGKVFVGASIHSILKKKSMRDGRINHKFEKKISAFRFEYSDYHW